MKDVDQLLAAVLMLNKEHTEAACFNPGFLLSGRQYLFWSHLFSLPGCSECFSEHVSPLLDGLYGNPLASSSTDEQDSMSVARVLLLYVEVFQALVDGSHNIAVILGLSCAVRKPVKIAGVVGSACTQLTTHPEAEQIGEYACELEFGSVTFGFLWVAHCGTFVIREPVQVTIFRPRSRRIVSRSDLVSPPKMP